MMMGRPCPEKRMTRLYAMTSTQMRYSGRVVTPIIPEATSQIHQLLQHINTVEFAREMTQLGLPKTVLPHFNAVFVNWYRPPSLTTSLDGLGYHADDETDLESDVILSLTLCPKGGERLFRFRAKRKEDGSVKTSGYDWEKELENNSILVMLNRCQQQYKHTVVPRSTRLDRSKITGGRLNLTFRALRTY